MTNIYNDKFCSACGNGLIQTAVVCPRCGSPVAVVSNPNPWRPAKSKTTAVVLAVFLSFWSWLYTYRDNKVKFWVSLPLELLRWLSIFAQVIYDLNCYYSCSGTTGFSVFQFFVGFPIWLWAVIDNARKPREYYEKYVR